MNYVLITASMFNSVLMAEYAARRRGRKLLRILLDLAGYYVLMAGVIFAGSLYSPEMREFLQSMIIWINGCFFVAWCGVQEEHRDDGDEGAGEAGETNDEGVRSEC